MKSILSALALGLSLTTAATAADLPARTAPLPPTITRTAPLTGFYVGADLGYGARGENFVGGINGGYDFGYFRLEAGYDYMAQGKLSGSGVSLATANGIVEYSFGAITPYALAGIGYSFGGGSATPWNDKAAYALGGGVRYAVTTNVELDARYRYVAPTDNRVHDHLLTAGVSYRF